MRKVSDYALQLREKQKVRRIYGMLEGQFHRYFVEAERMRGVTGENLLRLLESRFDNVVYRLGFAGSRNQARHLVRHNHFLLNGRKANIPSLQVKVGDVITVREKSKEVEVIKESLAAMARRGVPSWLELNQETFAGTVKNAPDRQELTMPIQEQLIVELYSK